MGVPWGRSAWLCPGSGNRNNKQIKIADHSGAGLSGEPGDVACTAFFYVKRPLVTALRAARPRVRFCPPVLVTDSPGRVLIADDGDGRAGRFVAHVGGQTCWRLGSCLSPPPGPVGFGSP